MYVTPAPGLLIPDPDLQDTLPVDGRDVPDTAYWQRRIADQDVVIKAIDVAAIVDKPVKPSGSAK